MQAAVWGVYLHARAGAILAKRVRPLGFLARELLAEIPALMCGLDKEKYETPYCDSSSSAWAALWHRIGGGLSGGPNYGDGI